MCVVVNLTARQFLQPNLVESVRAALEASSLEASRLELDLTEASVMTEGEEVTERLRQLRRLGVQLALDDFGTGYFSIRRIRDLGFRRLKIDRSLVSELPQGADQAAQVEAILALGKSLGLDVVAEGVETEAQRAFLESKGCTGLQGYLLSPPLAAEDVPAFLAEGEVAAQAAARATIRSSSALALSSEASSRSCARARSRLWPGREVR